MKKKYLTYYIQNRLILHNRLVLGCFQENKVCMNNIFDLKLDDNLNDNYNLCYNILNMFLNNNAYDLNHLEDPTICLGYVELLDNLDHNTKNITDLILNSTIYKIFDISTNSFIEYNCNFKLGNIVSIPANILIRNIKFDRLDI